MKYILYVVISSIVLLSCSVSRKIKDADELGKTVFNFFKNGQKEKIKDYLITKKEVKKVFSSDKEYNSLSESQKNETVNTAYNRIKEDGISFIDFYTDKENRESVNLQNGTIEKISSYWKQGGRPPALRIEVLFSSDGKRYYLNLDAAQIDDYWKLLSWIEVKKSFE